MPDLVSLLAQYGLALVFANLLLEQLGAPIPAVPTLVVAGALTADGTLSAPIVFAVAYAAAMIAETSWFIAGRIYGSRVLRLLCKISLSPDACVRQAEVQFERWGGFMLPVSKFAPGVSRIGPPLAGAMRMRFIDFFMWNSLGVVIWVGGSIIAGHMFHNKVADILRYLDTHGMKAIAIIVLLLAAYVGYLWLRRWLFFRRMRIARVSAAELRDLMKANKDTVVVDVRSPSARALDPRFVPGALALDDYAVLEQFSRDRELVFYCTCPNEASAAAVAKMLIDAGYSRVRPLAGGLDAWIEAGLEVERRAPG